ASRRPDPPTACLNAEALLADKDHHIIAESAAGGRQPAQFLSRINRVLLAAPTVQEGFMGRKTTQRKSVNRFTLGFVDLHRRMTIGAIGFGRRKRQSEGRREERSG